MRTLFRHFLIYWGFMLCLIGLSASCYYGSILMSRRDTHCGYVVKDMYVEHNTSARIGPGMSHGHAFIIGMDSLKYEVSQAEFASIHVGDTVCLTYDGFGAFHHITPSK